ARARRTVGADRASARGAVGWGTAAGGVGSGPGAKAVAPPGGRADGKPGSQDGQGCRPASFGGEPRAASGSRGGHGQPGAGRHVPANTDDGRRYPARAVMTLFRFLLRNLLFHWRANSAVFLGVVVGTAVLTGALLVGDSLRGSLRDLTLRRLGWI